MADTSDVEAALVGAIAAALFPASGPVLLADARIYRGWPNAAALDADLLAGRLHVTVFPSGAVRATTRWIDAPDAEPVLPSLRVVVSGATATFAGDASPGQLAGLLADNRAFVHRTAPGDTPALVAAVLADAVRAERIATLSGASVTVPGARGLIARVAADGAQRAELRRQAANYRVTLWCPTPALRDAAAAAVDAALASLTFLPLPDGAARLRGVGSATADGGQDAALFRRDLLLEAEYPTVLTTVQPAMLFGVLASGGTTITA